MSTQRNMYGLDAQYAGTIELVAETDFVDVTREELEAFDDSTFDTSGVDVPVDAADPSRLFERFDREQKPQVVEKQTAPATLFDTLPGESDVDSGGYDFIVPQNRVGELVPTVIRAYINIRNGSSTDRVVADPEFNLLFLQECWRLGIAASPKELNWVLLNARKAGKLKGTPPAKSYSIPKQRLDEFSFASEVALRYLQDQAFLSQQKELSLDKVLCDPQLVSQFDEVAQQLKPGYSSLDYRWAAIALRKARRSKVVVEQPRFDAFGKVDSLRVSRLRDCAGVFCLRSGSQMNFVGVAENMRLQIDHLLSAMGPHLVPEWMAGHSFEVAQLHLLEMPKTGTQQREQYRSAVLKANGSRLNFLKGSLFYRAA